MTIKEFLKKCIDNGVNSITTMELATKFKLSRSKAIAELKKLRKEGAVSFWNFGAKSYWEITLPTYYDYESKEYSDEERISYSRFEPRTYYELSLVEEGLSIVGYEAL